MFSPIVKIRWKMLGRYSFLLTPVFLNFYYSKIVLLERIFVEEKTTDLDLSLSLVCVEQMAEKINHQFFAFSFFFFFFFFFINLNSSLNAQKIKSYENNVVFFSTETGMFQAVFSCSIVLHSFSTSCRTIVIYSIFMVTDKTIRNCSA